MVEFFTNFWKHVNLSCENENCVHYCQIEGGNYCGCKAIHVDDHGLCQFNSDYQFLQYQLQPKGVEYD